MLVLTRKLGEAIQIGNQIELTILAIQGDQIKLGINAPKDIEIHRKEVYLTIQQSNNEAASINKDLITQMKNKQFRP
ncbi:carbon storage regulator CsrA [Metabacillus halosaccharovorans]|uniref:Translational regulator CsrA n=1 Tax=Metabacillus halosaccharovorans TaxID=930124 RepID=A0ABT3DDQ3_9BACI|nr:carbon storage regulator CsrA [Metabacillus halosaccharovorans]MCV9884676.1 carbon storage regulator CsrA [Metabacillus halosaccharovorans]